jgi:hypothetical protein
MRVDLTKGGSSIAFFDKRHAPPVRYAYCRIASARNGDQLLSPELDNPIVAPRRRDTEKTTNIGNRKASRIHDSNKPENAVIERRERNLLVDM